jgi:hypothetical protein
MTNKDDLSKEDYIRILKYYKQPIPNSKRLLQREAEKIVSDKLCRCIKKVDPVNEARSIGICTQSILNRKGISRGKFNCTGKKSIVLKKINPNNVTRSRSRTKSKGKKNTSKK